MMSRVTHSNNAIMITFVPLRAILRVSLNSLTAKVSNATNDKSRGNKVINSREQITVLIILYRYVMNLICIARK